MVKRAFQIEIQYYNQYFAFCSGQWKHATNLFAKNKCIWPHFTFTRVQMKIGSQFHLCVYWKAPIMPYKLKMCVKRNFWHHFCKGPQCGRLGLWHRQGGRRGAPEAAWCTCPSSHPENTGLRSCVCKENRICAIFGLIIWQEDECLVIYSRDK